MMKQIALGLAIVGCITTAHASDEKGNFITLGPGNDSCGRFLDAVNKANLHQNWTDWNVYGAYATGYFTGMNEYLNSTQNLLGKTDMDGVMANLESYCKKNPMKNFITGLQATATELYPNRKQ